jgi:hypothetical protein
LLKLRKDLCPTALARIGMFAWRWFDPSIRVIGQSEGAGLVDQARRTRSSLFEGENNGP